MKRLLLFGTIALILCVCSGENEETSFLNSTNYGVEKT